MIRLTRDELRNLALGAVCVAVWLAFSYLVVRYNFLDLARVLAPMAFNDR